VSARLAVALVAASGWTSISSRSLIQFPSMQMEAGVVPVVVAAEVEVVWLYSSIVLRTSRHIKL
jgi:hypothetical protein